MAFGDIEFFIVGYTDSSPDSKRKNYPILQKYKQTAITDFPSFPSSYTIYEPLKKYWFPFSFAGTNEEDYIIYQEGDELAWDDALELRPPELRFSNPFLNKYNDYESGQRIVFNNEIYVSTKYYFNWTDTKFAADKNPYKKNKVRKWKKFSDTAAVWTQYWYHPLLKRFYVVENTDQIQELPDFDEPDQSRWDTFVGDALDLNIDNFTIARIRELISAGRTLAAAAATINGLERITEPLETTESLTRTATASALAGKFTITNTAPGQEGQGSSTSQESLPRMTQRARDAKTGVEKVADVYYFNLRPNAVSYSNIGATWADIDRVNNFPMVDYRNPKLMTISFEFIVEETLDNVSSSYVSCEDKLNQLRRMASRPERVFFTNFDSIFVQTNPVEGKTSVHEFAIGDMTINSVQRTPKAVKSVLGEISRASVNITLKEVRMDRASLIFMPKIGKNPATPSIPGEPGDPKPGLNRLQCASDLLKKSEPCRTPIKT
jgi:hypothetical protein